MNWLNASKGELSPSVSGSTDKQRYLALETAFLTVVKSFILLLPIGIIGNTMTLLVTRIKENRRISTCVYMSALSVMDTIVLFIMAAWEILFVFGHGWQWEEDAVTLTILLVSVITVRAVGEML